VSTEAQLSADAAKALIALEDRLLEIERRMSGSPYEVLGVSEVDDEEAIRTALAEGHIAVEMRDEQMDVPPHLRRRLERARARLDEAAATLADPRARAALELDIGLALAEGRTDAVRNALREELAARREQAPEEERRAFPRARPYLERGTELLGAGDVKGARPMLRMARMLDPYDLEILDMCAAAHGVVASAESMAMLRGLVLPPTASTAEPSKATPPRPPPPKRKRSKPAAPARPTTSAERPLARTSTMWPGARLAGAMLLVIVLTASASAAAVLTLPIDDVLRLASFGAVDEEQEDADGRAAQAESESALPDWVRLLSQARDAADARDPAKAHTLAARSRELQPTEQALEVMAVSACRLQDPALARASFVKLVGSKARRRVAELCARDHIDLHQGAEAATATDLLVKAREAREAGKGDEACKLASQSQGLKHSVEALQMMVVCACRAGDSERAKRLADSLAVAEREPIRSECREHGIDLG
jgi:hypothetical protein